MGALGTVNVETRCVMRARTNPCDATTPCTQDTASTPIRDGRTGTRRRYQRYSRQNCTNSSSGRVFAVAICIEDTGCVHLARCHRCREAGRGRILPFRSPWPRSAVGGFRGWLRDSTWPRARTSHASFFGEAARAAILSLDRFFDRRRASGPRWKPTGFGNARPCFVSFQKPSVRWRRTGPERCTVAGRARASGRETKRTSRPTFVASSTPASTASLGDMTAIGQ